MASQAELEALLAAPALPPPEGVTPNFDSPPNRNGLAWFVTTLCIVVTTLCLLLRAYSRTWKVRKLHREEALMFLSYGAVWGTAYASYAMIETPGYYVHQWDLRMGDLVRPFYMILIYGCCYSAVLPLIKTAILLDWTRLFVVADKRHSPFWWCCILLCALQCIWGVACVALLNMQCKPHRAIWEFYLPSKCYDLPSVMLGSASVQVLTDFAMVLLPQRIIWTLQMNRKRKIGVSITFAVGLVACIAACFRLAHTISFAKEADRMYFIGPLLFWAWAEMTAGFFILSVPCLPKIIAESSLPSKVKAALGISSVRETQKTDPDGLVTFGGTGGSSHNKMSKSGLQQGERYHKMQEDGVGMTVFEHSESQEQLQQQGRSDNGGLAYK